MEKKDPTLRSCAVMGNSFTKLAKCFFRGFLTCQINSILKHVIANQVQHVSLYHTHCKVRPERVSRFEHIANIVRDIGTNHHWVHQVQNLGEAERFENCVGLILDATMLIPAFQMNFLFCFYTLLVDAIVYKLINHHAVNVDLLLNRVQSCIIEKKGVMILFNFLQRL